MVDRTSIRLGAVGALAALGALAATLAFRAAPSAAAAPDRGRCVGVFIANPGEGRLPLSVPVDTVGLAVRGSVPCKDAVIAWVAVGAYRAFEDGTVEFLAVPTPPCPGGDYYVWIAYPK